MGNVNNMCEKCMWKSLKNKLHICENCEKVSSKNKFRSSRNQSVMILSAIMVDKKVLLESFIAKFYHSV